MLVMIGSNGRIDADAEVQRARVDCVRKFDALPAPLREALRECPFDVHILRPAEHMILDKVVARIKAIRSVHEAMEFMADFGPISRGWH